HLELLVVRAQSAARLADREDGEHPGLRVLKRDEELVLRVPGIRFVGRLDIRHVARADVRRPVERAVRDQVGAAAPVRVGQQLLPAVPLVRAAEKGLTRLVAAVDVRDAEVVEFGPVEVEHDGLELERLGDALHDRRQRALEIPLAADHARHLEQRLHARAAEGLVSFLTPRTRSPHAHSLSTRRIALWGLWALPQPRDLPEVGCSYVPEYPHAVQLRAARDRTRGPRRGA